MELPIGLDEQQMQAISSTPDLQKRRPVSTKPVAEFMISPQVLAASPPEQLLPLTVLGVAIPHLWSIWECLVLSGDQ